MKAVEGLTRLIVRAILHSGYDEAFIDRARPGLTVSLNGIVTGNVQVAEQSGEVIGVVEVLSTVLQGIAVLGIFADPAHWKKGIGRALFETAIARARTLKVGALMILRVTIRGRLLLPSGRHQDRRGSVCLLARGHTAPLSVYRASDRGLRRR